MSVTQQFSSLENVPEKPFGFITTGLLLSSPHPTPNSCVVHHILSSLDQFIQKLEILDFSLPVVSQVRVAWTQPSTLLLFPKVSSFSQVVEKTEGRWKRCSGRCELGLWEETHTF